MTSAATNCRGRGVLNARLLLQALKNAGCTEVVLAINYQPKVRLQDQCRFVQHAASSNCQLAPSAACDIPTAAGCDRHTCGADI